MPEDLQFQVKVSSDTAGLKQTETALKGVTDAAQKTEKASQGASAAAKSLGSEMKGATKLAHDAEQAFAGFASGGIQGLVVGMRGLAGIIKELASGFGGILLPVLAAAAAALYVLQKAASIAADSLQKDFDDIAASAKRHQDAMSAMEAAAVKSLKSQQIEVEKLAADFKFLETATNRARAASDASRKAARALEDSETNVAEAKALSGAKNDTERAAIKAKFDDQRTATGLTRSKTDIGVEGDRAKLDYENAQEQERGARGTLNKADLDVSTAEGNVASAKDELKRVGLLGDFNRKQEAANRLREAEKGLELAQGNRKTVAGQLAGFSERVGTTQAAYYSQKENAPSLVQAAQNDVTAKQYGNRTQISGALNTASAKAEQQYAAGDLAGQSTTAAEVRRLRTELNNYDKATAAAVKATADDVKKNAAKAKATQEGGG